MICYKKIIILKQAFANLDVSHKHPIHAFVFFCAKAHDFPVGDYFLIVSRAQERKNKRALPKSMAC